MSKSNDRGSLMGLKASLPSMPRVSPVSFTTEMEEQILGVSAISTLHKDIRKDVKIAERQKAPARRKETAVLMNAKLPATLHARLKRTAQFNDISMTEILIRAIEAELDAGPYSPPPETWGSEMGE